MLSNFKVFAFVLAVQGILSGTCFHQTGKRQRVVAIHPAQNLAIASPDKRYVASVIVDSGTVAVLNVYHSGSHGDYGKRSLIGPIDDVWGFLWLPDHPHTLVYATSGISGTAMIGEYLCGGPNKVILAAKHPHRDVFTLYSASPDGRTINYGYAENYAPQYTVPEAKASERRLERHRRMLLTQ